MRTLDVALAAAAAVLVISAGVAIGLGAVRLRNARTIRKRTVAGVPGVSRGRSPAVPRGTGPVSGWAPRWFRRAVESMALAGEPVHLWRRACVTLLATALAVGAAAGPLAAVVAVATLAGVAAIVADLNRDRADRLAEAELPVLLDRLGSALRAGLSLPDAVREGAAGVTGPLARDLAWVVSSLDAGAPLTSSLAAWRSRRPTRGTRLVTAAVGLSWLLGGRSRPLDGVASTLRDHTAIVREVRAVSAQARASVAVLVATPWAFVAFSAVQDPAAIAFFTGSAAGAACLVAGAALDLAGAWLMSRMIGAVT